MTQIYFYSGAANKLNTACKITAKAIQQDLKVIIYTIDPVVIEQLDTLLWTFSPSSFVPHVRIHDKLAKVTPVLLGHEIEQISGYDVLLNLHHQCPSNFDGFQRVVEIAENSSEDKQVARIRYRFYQEKGYVINHYKLG